VPGCTCQKARPREEFEAPGPSFGRDWARYFFALGRKTAGAAAVPSRKGPPMRSMQ
jgi:hypothetical protein